MGREESAPRLTLHDLITRNVPPAPWAEGENIPWNEPGFSERMLHEHLDQSHDLATRRLPTVDRQVGWLQEAFLGDAGGRVLDLACGPGLYLHRFARNGHRGVGIDYSPASIKYARDRASEEGLDCEFIEGDIRTTRFEGPFDLALLVYGQFNVFRRAEAADILERIGDALRPGGHVVLEPERFENIRKRGDTPSSWNSLHAGLFSDRPHLLLTEHFWNENSRTTTDRFIIIDAASAEVSAHSLSTEAYTDVEMERLLDTAGFRNIAFYPSLEGTSTDDGALFVVSGQKPHTSE